MTSALEQIANAVLYEGFMLYPYRLSSVKNRRRWDFGVLFPEPFAGERGEKSWCQTQCLFQAGAAATVEVKVRFLQLVEGSPVEREVVVAKLDLESLAQSSHQVRLTFPSLEGVIEVSVPQPSTLSVRVTNAGVFSGEDRDRALAQSCISTHAIMTVGGGKFLSLIDPPEEWRAAAAQCRNIGAWPVLAGGNDSQMLSAPIILYDHPQVAPQSPGELFDSTEIDEILTLRIQTLTDEEKGQMRSSDDRVRSLLERSESLTREQLLSLRASMRPDPERLFHKGDRVRLQPRRRADIFDIALVGKQATILSIERDFDNAVHLCVTVDDDPGRDLGMEGKPGHRFFFRTDEVEPL